jgi:phage host-nuclease inhibitor protein Gam
VTESMQDSVWLDAVNTETANGQTIDVERELWFHKRDADRLAWIDRHAELQRERIAHWREQQRAHIERQMQFREQNLRNVLVEFMRAKTAKFVNGSIRLRKLPDRIEVDTEKFLTLPSVRDDGFVNTRTIETPNKKEIMQHLKETGELLEHCEFIDGGDRLYVDLEPEGPNSDEDEGASRA